MEESERESKRKRHKPIQPPSPSPESERKRSSTSSKPLSQRDSVFRRLGVPRENKVSSNTSVKQRKPPDICRHWKSRGYCDFGDKCCFEHPAHLARRKHSNSVEKTGSTNRWSPAAGSSRKSSPRQDRPTRRVTEISPSPRPSASKSAPANDGPTFNSPRIPPPHDKTSKYSPSVLEHENRQQRTRDESSTNYGKPRDKSYDVTDEKPRVRRSGCDLDQLEKSKRQAKDLPRAYASTSKHLQNEKPPFRRDVSDRNVNYDENARRSDNTVTKNSHEFDKSNKKLVDDKCKQGSSARSRDQREDDASRLRSLVVISRNSSNNAEKQKLTNKTQQRKDDEKFPFEKRTHSLSSRNSSPRRPRQSDRNDVTNSNRYDAKSARELEQHRDAIKRRLQLLDARKDDRDQPSYINRNVRDGKFAVPTPTKRNRASLYGRDTTLDRTSNRNISDVRRERDRSTSTTWRLNSSTTMKNRGVDESGKSNDKRPIAARSMMKTRRPVVAVRYQQQAVQKKRVNRLIMRRTGNLMSSKNAANLPPKRPALGRTYRNDRKTELFNRPAINKNVSSPYGSTTRSLSDRNNEISDKRASRSLNTSMDSVRDQPPKKRSRLEDNLTKEKNQNFSRDRRIASDLDRERKSNVVVYSNQKMDKKYKRKSEERKAPEIPQSRNDQDKRSSSVVSEKQKQKVDLLNKEKIEECGEKTNKNNKIVEISRTEKAVKKDKETSKDKLPAADQKPNLTSTETSELDKSADSAEIQSSAGQDFEPISDEESQEEPIVASAVTTENLRVDWSVLVKAQSAESELVNQTPSVSENAPNEDEQLFEEQTTAPSALDRFKLRNLLPRLYLNSNLLGPQLTKQLETVVNKHRREKDLWKISDGSVCKRSSTNLSILNNIGPYRKALSARHELVMRRRLCGLHEEPPQHLLMNASEVGAPFNNEIYIVAKNLLNKSHLAVP